ncbi:MAG TPA: PAS domain S-box protein [Xanthomonadales bacterium]|nr:PAS domain S-box protein [Xanthomonadales bacterium]
MPVTQPPRGGAAPAAPFAAHALDDAAFRALVDSVSDYGIFLLDNGGHVVSWNAGAARIKGYTADEIIGQHFSRFYPAEAVARDWPAIELERAQRDGRFEDEGWRVRKDGTLFWANVVITALFDRNGGLRGYAKVTRDLSERRKHEEALRRSEERFRLLVESVEDYAIFMLDESGFVQTWNAGAALNTGYTAAEAIGRHFSIFYPPDQIARAWPTHELEVASREGSYEEEGWRIRKDGRYYWASVVITALRDDSGRLCGFAKVTRDLSQRRRVEQLEADSRRMNEFLAMLAHELRNPLAPIRNAASLLARAEPDRSRTEWAAGIIERQVAHMSRMVDDLLDVSRITEGKIQIERRPVDLAEVVARAVESARPDIDARQHALELEVDGPVMVNGDVYRLTQVVTNLLHNAAKFTPPGGRIAISLSGEDRAVLRVRDNGEGIAPELLPRVFDLFTQGDSTIDRARGGLGLGLTIVRRLIEMHGGAVEANSPGTGHGSEFSVILPVLPASKARPTRPAAAGEAPVAASLRVLVVDDNTDSANSMKLLLELRGYTVAAAHDGDAAIATAQSFAPDVVLLDIGLPGKSGYDVARELRANPRMAGVHVIAVTGYGAEGDRQRAIEAGVDEHLVKPVDPDTLFARLAAIES